MKTDLFADVAWLAFIEAITNRLEEEGLKMPELKGYNDTRWSATKMVGRAFEIEVRAEVRPIGRCLRVEYTCSFIVRDTSDLSKKGGMIKIEFVGRDFQEECPKCYLSRRRENARSTNNGFTELQSSVELGHLIDFERNELSFTEAMMLVRLIAIKAQRIAKRRY